MHYIIYAFFTLTLFYSFASSGIIIRHDKDDDDYQALAQPYLSSLAFTPNCVATVIDPHWLITAAHCVSPEQTFPAGIQHLGIHYPVERIVPHPQFGEEHDIALLQLKWPLEGATIVSLYHGRDEKNKG